MIESTEYLQQKYREARNKAYNAIPWKDGELEEKQGGTVWTKDNTDFYSGDLAETFGASESVVDILERENEDRRQLNYQASDD